MKYEAPHKVHYRYVTNLTRYTTQQIQRAALLMSYERIATYSRRSIIKFQSAIPSYGQSILGSRVAETLQYEEGRKCVGT